MYSCGSGLQLALDGKVENLVSANLLNKRGFQRFSACCSDIADLSDSGILHISTEEANNFGHIRKSPDLYIFPHSRICDS